MAGTGSNRRRDRAKARAGNDLYGGWKDRRSWQIISRYHKSIGRTKKAIGGVEMVWTDDEKRKQKEIEKFLEAKRKAEQVYSKEATKEFSKEYGYKTIEKRPTKW